MFSYVGRAKAWALEKGLSLPAHSLGLYRPRTGSFPSPVNYQGKCTSCLFSALPRLPWSQYCWCQGQGESQDLGLGPCAPMAWTAPCFLSGTHVETILLSLYFSCHCGFKAGLDFMEN